MVRSEKTIGGKNKEVKKLVPDTSILIDKVISEMLERGDLGHEGLEIIIPQAVLDELQAQASRGKEHGFVGLEELKTLRKLSKEYKFKLRFTGKRPSLEDIQLAKNGRMDAIIRDVAKQENAQFMTADYVQALVGEAEGVETSYIAQEVKKTGLLFEKYFDDKTISVHLKEGVIPMAKRGEPGKFLLTEVGEKELDKKELEKIIKEIDDAARIDEESRVEINRRGAMVIQLGHFRIAIARPPFSDGVECTIVRPIVKLNLEDYRLSEKLMNRLGEMAEGVIIAGPPGSGKTTLASGIAEFYMNKGKIVKTLESPRDLQVGPQITQYAPLEGSYEKSSDILLLVRPDYTVFDEVRKSQEFRVFSDLRLAGVGMIGVVHASKAIDAIQRFIGKIELGMIPHVVDTIIYVNAGRIEKVYEVEMVVKVPYGMVESDLARPVVIVKDFESGKLEYEIYTFGEENIVMQVKEEKASGAMALAAQVIRDEFKKYDRSAEVEMVSDNRVRVYLDNTVVPIVIGKEGKNINALQEKLGIGIDVEPKTVTLGKDVGYELKEVGGNLEFKFNKKLIGENVSLYVEDNYLLTAAVGKKGKIKLKKTSEAGRIIVKADMTGKRVRALI